MTKLILLRIHCYIALNLVYSGYLVVLYSRLQCSGFICKPYSDFKGVHVAFFSIGFYAVTMLVL